MGAGTSVGKKSPVPQLAGKERIDEIVKFVLPVYYTTAPITAEELDEANKVWKMVMNNRSVHFDSMKKADPEKIHHANVMELFYEVFYTRQFDVHPTCKPLFKRPINKQGNFLMRIISMLLAEIDQPDKFHKTLVNLTNLHNKIGVVAYEYGISGEILLFTLKKVLGDAFTPLAHRAWIKIYSRILDHIVPNAVEFEINNKKEFSSIQETRAHLHVVSQDPVFSDRVAADKDGGARPATSTSVSS